MGSSNQGTSIAQPDRTFYSNAAFPYFWEPKSFGDSDGFVAGGFLGTPVLASSEIPGARIAAGPGIEWPTCVGSCSLS